MKNQKGFTLVEIIVAMAVGAIFVMCVIALISPTTKIFNRVETSADARLMTESILEEVRNIANYASKLEADKDGKTIVADESVISVDKDGYLIKTDNSGSKPDEQKLFDPKFYAGKTVSMTTAQDGYNCVDMTLKVFFDGREIYSVDSRLKPVINKSDTFDKNTPEGMLRVAREEKNNKAHNLQYYRDNYKVTNVANGIHSEMKHAVYDGHFPEYSILNVLSRNTIEAKLTGNNRAAWLEQKTYLCCYVNPDYTVPIVFITNESGYTLLEPPKSQAHTSALAVYWDHKWYVKANLSTSYITFLNLKEDQIKDKLLAEKWVPASELEP